MEVLGWGSVDPVDGIWHVGSGVALMVKVVVLRVALTEEMGHLIHVDSGEPWSRQRR